MCENTFNVKEALENLIGKYDTESKDACNQSNTSLTDSRMYYYMGIDSALSGVLGDLGSLLTEVIINKSEG